MPRRSKNSASLWKCDEFWRRALASPRSSTHNVGFLCSNRFSMRMKLHREFPFLTGFLNGIGVIDQMHFCVRALDEHITRSEEHTSELQSQSNLVCRLLL